MTLALAASVLAAVGFSALAVHGARLFTATREIGVLAVTVLAGCAALASLIAFGLVLAGRLP